MRVNCSISAPVQRNSLFLLLPSACLLSATFRFGAQLLSGCSDAFHHGVRIAAHALSALPVRIALLSALPVGITLSTLSTTGSGLGHLDLVFL